MQLHRAHILALAALALAGAATAQNETPSVDEIVQKHTQAMGGADKLKSLRTVKMTGSATVAGMEAPTVMVAKRPDKVRMDLTVMDQKVIQGADGSSAWMINPFMGGPDAQPMTDEMAADFRSSAELEGPLVDYKAKGNTLELLGKESVDGKPAYKLKLTRNGGRSDVLFLDAATYMQVKALSHRNLMGTETDIETLTSDFKEVDGFKMAHKIDQSANGNPAFSMTVEKIEINVPVDDSIFAKPAKQPEKAPEPEKK
jgi:outer membrane lipoprotein-sorting protein